MKITKLSTTLALALILATTSITFVSCDKSSETQEIVADGIQLNVKFGAIDQPSLPKVGKIASSAKNAVKENNGVTEIAGGDFDVLIGLEDRVQGLNKLAATQDLSTQQVAYKFFYGQSDGTFQQISLMSNNTSPVTISVTPGVQYQFYAISYLNNTPIADITDLENLAVEANKELVYASGTFTPTAQSANVNINFKRLFSRLDIELDALGVFGKINSADVTVSGTAVGNGTLNIKTGGINVNAAPIELDYSNFQDPAGYTYGDKKVLSLNIPVNQTATSGVTIGIADLVIQDYNNASTTRTLSGSMNFSVTPEKGKYHKLTARIIDGGILYNGVRWARTNLYYGYSKSDNDNTNITKHNPYRFFLDEDHKFIGTSYFGFNKLVPFNGSPDGDPCTKVYPEGTWVTPTNAQINTLPSASIALPAVGSQTTLLSHQTENNRSFYYVKDEAGNNVLRFNHNGRVISLNLLQDLLPIDLNQLGTEGHYWSSTSTIDGGSILSVGYKYLKSDYSTSSLISKKMEFGSTTSLLTGLSLLDIDVLSMGAKNIRCVRAN